MNRTIKFRGTRIDNGELVFGFLYHESDGGGSWHILDWNNEWDYPVDPDSVAQLVGYDKDGNEVYEDDEIIGELGYTTIVQYNDSPNVIAYFKLKEVNYEQAN